MTTPTFDPDRPLPDMPDPWAGTSVPAARSGPPYAMTEMIAAEPALAERVLAALGRQGGGASTLAGAIRDAAVAREPPGGSARRGGRPPARARSGLVPHDRLPGAPPGRHRRGGGIARGGPRVRPDQGTAGVRSRAGRHVGSRGGRRGARGGGAHHRRRLRRGSDRRARVDAEDRGDGLDPDRLSRPRDVPPR